MGRAGEGVGGVESVDCGLPLAVESGEAISPLTDGTLTLAKHRTATLPGSKNPQPCYILEARCSSLGWPGKDSLLAVSMRL